MKILTDNRFEIIFFAFIIISTFLSFSDISNQQFLDWDDNTYIDSNDNIKSLTAENIAWMFTDYGNNNWHPVTWLTYAVNYHFWGKNAFVFKLTNLIFHLLTCLALFYTTKILISTILSRKHNFSTEETHRITFYSSALTTLLFAIHPQHIESVIWISGRKDIVSAFFYLFGICCYLKQHTADNEKKWQYMTALFFILDKIDKNISAILSIYNLVKNKVFYLAVSFCVGMITVITQSTQIVNIEKLPFFKRLLNTFENLIHHLTTMIYPERLSPYHPFSLDQSAHSIDGYIAFTLVAIISAIAVYMWKRGHKYVLAVWLAYIVMLLPTSGLLRVGHAAVADRYSYLPTTVIFMLASFYFTYFIFSSKATRYSKIVTSVLMATVVLSLSSYTSFYSTHWRNDENLWTYSIKKYPKNAVVPYINLGTQYDKQKKHQSSIISFLNSLNFDPYNRYALEYLGMTFMQIRHKDIGLNYFTKLMEIRPDLPNGYIHVGDYHYAHNNIDKALNFYNNAIKISPTDPKTILRSALVDLTINDLPSAKRKLNYLMQLNPQNYHALKLLAQAELRAQNYESAHMIANRMLHLAPDDRIAKDILQQINNKN